MWPRSYSQLGVGCRRVSVVDQKIQVQGVPLPCKSCVTLQQEIEASRNLVSFPAKWINTI